MDKTKMWVFSTAALGLFLAWGFLGKLLTGLSGSTVPQLTYMLAVKGSLAVMLLIAMARFGGLKFYGIQQSKGWWFLLPGLPIILMSVMVLLNPEAKFGLPIPAVVGWLLVSLAVGVAEEGMFRGILWRALDSQNLIVTSLITSILFGVVHLSGLFSDIPWQIIASQAVFAAGMGMMFAAVRVTSGSIAAPILLHAGFDAAAITAAGGVREMFNDTMTPERLLVPGVVIFLWGLGAVLILARRRAKAQSAGVN